jgi:hypothetical protein
MVVASFSGSLMVSLLVRTRRDLNALATERRIATRATAAN